eukprot:TRINITY_DN373_c0_g1_i1.p1 TRINITY_DN373_c0_g1~~TRINITY_DN373_c0_g1_i1.p1  ORF type:complete len:829 (+),score=84.97 TRINITY_DN373_c0_g1_i1:41-2527(+)
MGCLPMKAKHESCQLSTSPLSYYRSLSATHTEKNIRYFLEVRTISHNVYSNPSPPSSRGNFRFSKKFVEDLRLAPRDRKVFRRCKRSEHCWNGRKIVRSAISLNPECDTLHDPTMVVDGGIRLSEGSLLVNGQEIITKVPHNVILTPDASAENGRGVFVGCVAEKEDCRHAFLLGCMRDIRFLSCFRFKLWWMTQRVGQKASEIPVETQFLLLECPGSVGRDAARGGDLDVTYVVLLPLLDGAFRSSLKGNQNDELLLLVESGDPAVKSKGGNHALYMHAGPDPYQVTFEALRAVELHTKSFLRREAKRLPGMLDYFGWCTWDAFYTDVSVDGVHDGLSSLAAGGCPAKFLIIDDGWQSVAGDADMTNSVATVGTQYAKRLTGVKANSKFEQRARHVPGVDALVELGHVVQEMKASHDVNYLAEHGVDGVKVDVQSIVETLGAGYGGRVVLTKLFHQALEQSISKNFKDNGIISCMSHHNDSLFSSMQTAVVRASDDFWPRDPASHTTHITSVAYNSLFLGEFMQPDWDMFHSKHLAGEYHGAARAVGGCAVYVSDKPGEHDFELLRKLVLLDGTVLRALLPGRPSRDCLFIDPARDKKSLLKIWNLNRFTGVVGVFNCQGAGWCTRDRKYSIHDTNPGKASGAVQAMDVDALQTVAPGPEWNGDVAAYAHRSGLLKRLPKGESIPLTLGPLGYEVFAISPIRVLPGGIEFAPLGLVDMFNAGGALVSLDCPPSTTSDTASSDPTRTLDRIPASNEGTHPNLSSFTSQRRVRMGVRGHGRWGAFSSQRPKTCTVDEETCMFAYDEENGCLSLQLKHLAGHVWTVTVEF